MDKKQDGNTGTSAKVTDRQGSGPGKSRQSRSSQQTRSSLSRQQYDQNRGNKKQSGYSLESRTAEARASERTENQGRSQNRPKQPGRGGYTNSFSDKAVLNSQSDKSDKQTRSTSPVKEEQQPVRKRINTDHAETHSEEGDGSRNHSRDKSKYGSRQQRSSSAEVGSRRSRKRNRIDETIDDIKEDIKRLEKEIGLEIKEIRSLKL